MKRENSKKTVILICNNSYFIIYRLNYFKHIYYGRRQVKLNKNSVKNKISTRELKQIKQ